MRKAGPAVANLSKPQSDLSVGRPRRDASSRVTNGKSSTTARRFWQENSLSLVLFGCFLVFLLGQAVAGHHEYNEGLREHGEATIGFSEYLHSDHFFEATTENWESEFLQMFAYVLFTVFFYQKGSAESKDPSDSEEVDREPNRKTKNVPWPVRKGGFILKLYENSLSLAFLFLFVASFVMHAVTGTGLHNREQLQHSAEPVSILQYIGTARFWFESLQNWQSEFLAIAAMVVLSIFLRQKGSPESKPVDSPHDQTGSD